MRRRRRPRRHAEWTAVYPGATPLGKPLANVPVDSGVATPNTSQAPDVVLACYESRMARVAV